MKLEIKLTYGDETKETFIASDYPAVGDFITIYKEHDRFYIKSNTVTRMELKLKR